MSFQATNNAIVVHPIRVGWDVPTNNHIECNVQRRGNRRELITTRGVTISLEPVAGIDVIFHAMFAPTRMVKTPCTSRLVRDIHVIKNFSGYRLQGHFKILRAPVQETNCGHRFFAVVKILRVARAAFFPTSGHHKLREIAEMIRVFELQDPNLFQICPDEGGVINVLIFISFSANEKIFWVLNVPFGIATEGRKREGQARDVGFKEMRRT